MRHPMQRGRFARLRRHGDTIAEDRAGSGWDTEPDRAGRLRLLTGPYGHNVRPEQVVDFAALRLLAMAAHLDDRVHAADPAYTVHRDEDHAAGYRRAAAYILSHRAELLDYADPSI
jgi:hypothetical protein